jgi:hypothetical protein
MAFGDRSIVASAAREYTHNTANMARIKGLCISKPVTSERGRILINLIRAFELDSDADSLFEGMRSFIYSKSGLVQPIETPFSSCWML